MSNAFIIRGRAQGNQKATCPPSQHHYTTINKQSKQGQTHETVLLRCLPDGRAED